MNKTKAIITSVCVLVAAAIGTGIFLIVKNNNNDNSKYYTVSFDTQGGSVVESIKVKENESISYPENPTKEGYEFLGWTIVGEKFNKDMVVTKDITLTAVWSEIIDDPTVDPTVDPEVDSKDPKKKTTTKKTTTTTTTATKNSGNNEPAKKYTCDNGYELKGTKCVKTYDAPHRCTDGYTEIDGKCIAVTSSKKVNDTLKCINGTQIPGRNSCQGNRISSDSSNSCANAGGVWLDDVGECRSKYEEKHICPSNYTYIGNPNKYNSNIHDGGGCYPIGSMKYTCTNSKTDKLEGTKCISTIDAKLA